MGSSTTTSRQRPFGSVDVDEAIRSKLSRDQISSAIAQLRFAGSTCWICEKMIRPDETSSMLVHLTSVAGRQGFAHARCAGSGLIDDRGNRRAALQARGRIEDVATDVLAFLAYRKHLSPRALVVVSPMNPVSFISEDDSLGWLVSSALARGMEPLASGVLDAVPAPDASWSVTQPAPGRLVVSHEDETFYDGEVADVAAWTQAVGDEHECLILCAGIGVRSEHLSEGVWSVLDALSRRGELAGVVAKVRVASANPVVRSRSSRADRQLGVGPRGEVPGSAR